MKETSNETKKSKTKRRLGFHLVAF